MYIKFTDEQQFYYSFLEHWVLSKGSSVPLQTGLWDIQVCMDQLHKEVSMGQLGREEWEEGQGDNLDQVVQVDHLDQEENLDQEDHLDQEGNLDPEDHLDKEENLDYLVKVDQVGQVVKCKWRIPGPGFLGSGLITSLGTL